MRYASSYIAVKGKLDIDDLCLAWSTQESTSAI
jgi:hypothetical protein